MFRKLRIQFVMIATAAVIVMLIAIIGILNASRFAVSEKRINRMLDLLTENEGELPDVEAVERILGRKINTDILMQYRYFSADVDENNMVVTVNAEHISSLSETDVRYYVNKILSDNRTYGNFITTDGQRFAYKLTTKENSENKIIVVLDYTSFYEDRADLIETSVFLFFSNLTFFLIIFIIFSGRVIKPFIENYQNQRAFITNAGHELKTPLAIIFANNGLIEMISGENEWTKSTNEQIQRLDELINRLIAVAKFEEQSQTVLTNTNFSEIVEKSSKSFTSLAIKGGRKFDIDVQKDLNISGDGNSLYELVNILLDNANKYCDNGGTIGVKLSVQGITFKKARLEVYNTYKSGKGIDHSKFFDRFYREDKSHNSIISGYGVGLSIAQNIVKRNKGRIHVSYKDDIIYFIISFNILDKQKIT